MAKNKRRMPAETLAALLELLQHESPDDRIRLIDAAIVWFTLGGELLTFSAAVALQGGETDGR